ncbi:KR domain-containing protein [Microbispora bryophytorum]|uniref:KR domain-containing protein n=1 Tax=Microbispora bryophytorum TaxID=1460882 RepID=UPI0033DB152C
MSPAAPGEILRQTLTLCPLPPVPAPPEDVLDGRSVLVINGSDPVRRSVCRAVCRYGGTPVTDPDATRIDAIIDLTLHGDPEETCPGAWREPMRRTVAALQHVYPDWVTETDARRLHYVAVTAMGGPMGLRPEQDSRPLSGIWAGIAKTLPRELAACQSRVIDLGPVADPGEAIVREMFAGDLLEVGLRYEERLTILPRQSAVDGAPIEMTPADVLLLTGGGRGIGFEIAAEMARGTGCRVIVSGRTRLPGEDTPWLTADADEFADLALRAYREREPGEPLPVVRRRIEGMRQVREIYGNLRRAREAGLRIDYHAADVTRAEDLAALLAAAGPGLSMVVHNAGVDAPTRLPRKTAEEFLRVIEVKVDGFLRLTEALEGRPLKMLCAVGSLTGRYGGMIGQIDYAAANEGLARLAMWTGHSAGHPVKSLSWPTWHDLGLITNLGAASRYMTPISVPTGVAAWRAELAHAGSGEIGFVADIGEITPRQLCGITLPSDWEGRTELLTRRFLLGQVVRYGPGTLLETEHRIDGEWAAFLDDVRVAGVRGVPISLLLEYMLAGASWLAPPLGPLLPVAGMRDVWVNAGALAAGGGSSVFHRLVRPDPHSPDWQVRVELSRDGRPFARGTAVFQPEPPPSVIGRGGPPERRARDYLWRPFLTDVDSWTLDDQAGCWSAEVTRTRASDLFTMTSPPRITLPIAHLEAAIATASGRSEVWRLASLDLHEPRGTPARLLLGADGAGQVVDAERRPLVSIGRCRWDDQP